MSSRLTNKKGPSNFREINSFYVRKVQHGGCAIIEGNMTPSYLYIKADHNRNYSVYRHVSKECSAHGMKD